MAQSLILYEVIVSNSRNVYSGDFGQRFRRKTDSSLKLSDHFSLLVEERKVLGYLLSSTHPLGREKAVVFSGLGFGPDNWVLFSDRLREIAATTPAYPAQEIQYGRKYLVCGTLVGPTGRKAVVNTVWIVAPGESVARLVTAYPRGKR